MVTRRPLVTKMNNSSNLRIGSGRSYRPNFRGLCVSRGRWWTRRDLSVGIWLTHSRDAAAGIRSRYVVPEICHFISFRAAATCSSCHLRQRSHSTS